jgi:hypothetical protein
MKVLVADRFEQGGLDGLATPGCEVVYAPKLQGAARQNHFARPRRTCGSRAAIKEADKAPNLVNRAPRSPAAHRLIVGHRDHPGVLVHVFRRLGAAHLIVRETENVVFDGAAAAVARIDLERAPWRAICAQIVQGNDDSGSQARCTVTR